MKKVAFYTLFLTAFALIVSCSTNSTKTTDTEEALTILKPSLTKVWETDTTLITPESVLYDTANDFYYVSCIGGVPPTQKDGDGYIAKIDANGKIISEKWATGMSAPKGMALVGNTLYVTDISRIVMIDVTTGKIIDSKEIEGATFLNDMDAASDGTIYFTDSDNADAYMIKEGVVTKLFRNTDLKGINGVFVNGNNLMFSSMEAGNVVNYSLENKSAMVVADSIFGGDGIEKYNTGFIVSNWNGEVYHLTADWKKTKLLDTTIGNKQNAADVEVVASKNLLLVPTFFANKVVAYKMEGM